MLGLLAASEAAGQWVNINPGGGGAFTAIGAGPTGTLICTSDLSGAYRSRDRGLTWDLIGSERGLRRTHVSAVGFDPLDPQIIHLGTEVGLYRSADGGDSFQQVLATGYIGAVVPARSDPAIVYAAYHPQWDSFATDLYRSADRGQSWSAVGGALPAGLRVLKLVVSPVDPQRLYLVSGKDLFVTGTAGVWRSLDGGLTWGRVGESLGNLWDLAMDPASPATLYVTAYQGTPGVSWSGWVYKSTDGGDTWAQKTPHTGAIALRRDQPQVVRVIDVGRHSSHAESGVWETTDGGETWQRKSTMTGWDPGWQVLDRAYGTGAYGTAKVLGEDLSDPNAIFWVTWQFVFGSFDGGGGFQNLFTTPVAPGRWRSRGIDNVTLAALDISEANPAHVYTGYHDLGFWRSLDGGASWQPGNSPTLTGTWSGYGGNVTAILSDPVRPGVVWAANGRHADSTVLALSSNSGAASSWVAASGLPVGFLRGLSLSRHSPVNRRAMYVTANGDVYRSLDDGESWWMVFDCDGCRTTAVDRHDGSLVYAGGEGGLWRSQAGGSPGSWTPIGPPEMAGANPKAPRDEQWEGVHAIVPDPQISGRAYVAAYGSGRGLYRTEDRGLTWTKLRSAIYLRDAAVHRTNPGILYAGGSRVFKSGGGVTGSEGVLRSTDGGQTWTPLNDGLAWPYAARIAVDPANLDRLILGSPGAGFLERRLGGVTDVGTPGGATTFSVSSAFPSPSRGMVTFALDLERPARVSWRVFDVLGRTVWSGDSALGAGPARLAWEAPRGAGARLADGVYFARFEVEGSAVVRRFALVQ